MPQSQSTRPFPRMVVVKVYANTINTIWDEITINYGEGTIYELARAQYQNGRGFSPGTLMIVVPVLTVVHVSPCAPFH